MYKLWTIKKYFFFVYGYANKFKFQELPIDLDKDLFIINSIQHIYVSRIVTKEVESNWRCGIFVGQNFRCNNFICKFCIMNSIPTHGTRPLFTQIESGNH